MCRNIARGLMVLALVSLTACAGGVAYRIEGCVADEKTACPRN